MADASDMVALAARCVRVGCLAGEAVYVCSVSCEV